VIQVPTTEPSAPTIDPNIAAEAAIIPEFIADSQRPAREYASTAGSPRRSGRRVKVRIHGDFRAKEF